MSYQWTIHPRFVIFFWIVQMIKGNLFILIAILFSLYSSRSGELVWVNLRVLKIVSQIHVYWKKSFLFTLSKPPRDYLSISLLRILLFITCRAGLAVILSLPVLVASGRAAQGQGTSGWAEVAHGAHVAVSGVAADDGAWWEPRAVGLL